MDELRRQVEELLARVAELERDNAELRKRGDELLAPGAMGGLSALASTGSWMSVSRIVIRVRVLGSGRQAATGTQLIAI